MKALRSVAALAATYSWTISGGSAQEVARWEDFSICDGCQLRLAEVVRLGDAEGEGIIAGDFPQVVWSDFGYLVFRRGGSRVQLFSNDGRFVRSIGRSGEGPGEFSGTITGVQAIDGRILISDGRKRAFIEFDERGGHMGSIDYGFRSGDFVSVGFDRVVMFSMDRSPDLVGYPLHLVDVSAMGTRTAPVHFGTENANAWSARVPLAGFVIGSVIGGPTLWWGSGGSPAIQQWSVDGEHLQTIDGELPWFPKVTALIPNPSQPPPSTLKAIATDPAARLWMLTHQADRGWREVARQGAEGGITESSYGEYYDSRLDVFDLGTRNHLGSYTWDPGSVMLIDNSKRADPRDWVRISTLEFNESVVPQVVVYRALWN